MSWVLGAVLIWVAGWALNIWLARRGGMRAVRIAVPVIFGLTLLALWEAPVRGFGVSPVILPPPPGTAPTKNAGRQYSPAS